VSRKATDLLARVQRTVTTPSPISTADEAATADTPAPARRSRRPERTPAPRRPAPSSAAPGPAADQATAPTARRSGQGRRRRRRAAEGEPNATRYTVDLEAPLHRALHVFALDNQADASEVVRALIRRLDQDPALAAAVVAELEAEAEA
jgi:hypothetical protein